MPESASWILDSRVVFLRKPGTDAPRPIRVGEMWRRVVAKRLVHAQRTVLQKLFLKHRQCGVGLPGGADALVHLRRSLEQAMAECDGEALALLDLDLRNAFPSLEWDAIEAAVSEHAPELGPWTRWCHGAPAHVQLPGGAWVECDRGAEQGDPLGPAYCGLTLLRCAEAARMAVEAAGGWVWDAWYMDDGQIVLPPAFAATYLHAFDRELEQAGGTRVAGCKLKSTARLLGPLEARRAVHASWSAGVVAATCKVLSADDDPAGRVLGVEIEGASLREQFSQGSQDTAAVCEALGGIGDPRAELALLRVSANVSRVTHLLRAAGPEIPHEALEDFDTRQRQALGAIVATPLSDVAWAQAQGGAKEGGLGLRSACELRYPAFIASRTETRSLAELLTRGLPESVRAPVLAHWDTSTAAAVVAWTAELAPATAALAKQHVEAAAAEAARTAAQLAGLLPGDWSGSNRGGQQSPADALLYTGPTTPSTQTHSKASRRSSHHLPPSRGSPA